MIEIKDIKRSFRSPVKSEGFGEAIRLLLNPKYTEFEALKGVSFSIQAGSFVGLIGANGAGKTTLLKILSGLIPPTSGTARVLGVDPFTRPLEFRKQIALVMGQKAQLWWDLPGIDAFDLLRAIYEIPEKVYRERLHELASLLDVERHLGTQIRRLSLGERMKMELIGALLHWPKVIFLDEPTIGLDVLAAHRLREFLRQFNEKQKSTIILTSHNMEDIEKLCSRVLILQSGQLIYDGNPEGLTKAGECRLRIELAERLSIDELESVTGVAKGSVGLAGQNDDTAGVDDEVLSRTYYFTTRNELVAPILQKLMSKCQIINMGMEEPSLESVIQRLWEKNA